MTQEKQIILIDSNIHEVNGKRKHSCSIICPDVEYLNKTEILTDVVCPVPNCDLVFSQVSALNLHLEKSHRLNQRKEIDQILVTKPMTKEQKASANCKCKYYCPVETCKFNLSTGKRSLPTFHSLKNHYIRIHGNKKFKCKMCFKSFSIKSDAERHELSCGKFYNCPECNINYTTYQALSKHAKKKNHSLETLKSLTQGSMNTSSIANSNKMPLCKKHILDSNLINTNAKCLKTNNYLSLSQNDSCYQELISNSISQPTNSNIINLMPLFLFSVNSPGHLVQSQAISKESALDGSDVHCQRSFGCQANDQNDLIITQEVGSQTVLVNSNQYQQSTTQTTAIFCMDSYKDYEQVTLSTNSISGTNILTNQKQQNPHDLYYLNFNSQETQTNIAQNLNEQQRLECSTSANTASSSEDDFYLDAATSTSPLINFEILFNDISTQTIVNVERRINEMNNQEAKLTNTNSIQVNFDMLDARASNMSTSTHQENILNCSISGRCTTPSVSNVQTFVACQTEEYFLDNSFNAATNNSTQKSTSKYFNYNVVETQTEWDEFLN